MDLAAALSKTIDTTKSARVASITGTVNALDALTPVCSPFAARWDAEADRRRQLRTPENLKKLMTAQREHNSARATAATAKNQRRAARSGSKNPLSTTRRAARVAHRAAQQQHDQARGELRAAKSNYPSTLKARAVQIHAAHTTMAGLSSWVLTEAAHQLTVWPGMASATLVGLNVAGLWLGRRNVTVEVEDGVSIEERQLMERLDPSYWVQHAADRGLDGTVTTPPTITTAGIECDIRLDGQWTVKKLRAATDAIRALLGARTALPMLVGPGSRGGWGVIRLRTRSAAPDGAITWQPGDSLGVDMVTGEDVRVGLGDRMLIAGMSGSGKSTASRPLLFDASEGPTNALVIIDLKKVEGRLWDHRARVAHNPIEVIELVADLVAELEERLDVLPKGQATLIPTAERPRITVVVDEGAEVVSSCTKVEVLVGYTEKDRPIYEKRNALLGLDSVARMGRAGCIDLWWMTQSPTYGDGVPRQIAKQLGTRISLAIDSPSEARVVFGESAQDKGWKADELPMPGVAMIRDGKRTPDPVKIRYITDGQVIALPAQPIWTRAEAKDEAGRPALRLVKQSLVGELDDEVQDEVAEESVYLDAVPQQGSNRDRVMAAVRAGAFTARAATEATGLNKGTVSREVKALVEAGALVRAEDGTLAIAAGEVSA